MKWEYCECGCHGHTLHLPGLYFWHLNTLSKAKGSHWLSINYHGPLHGTLKFDTVEELDEHVRTKLQEHLSVLKQTTKDIEKYLRKKVRKTT